MKGQQTDSQYLRSKLEEARPAKEWLEEDLLETHGKFEGVSQALWEAEEELAVANECLDGDDFLEEDHGQRSVF